MKQRLSIRSLLKYLNTLPKQNFSGKVENTDFTYSKVEVYWPCEWLEGGITIVDSPGVGEDQHLTELVKKYIPLASGFIYVINTINAGGLDPDRVCTFLKKIHHKYFNGSKTHISYLG